MEIGDSRNDGPAASSGYAFLELFYVGYISTIRDRGGSHEQNIRV